MKGISDFYLLTPQQLPTQEKELQTQGRHEKILSKFFLALNQGASRLILLQELLEEFNVLLPSFFAIHHDMQESSHNKYNDSAFNIVRVTGNVMDVLSYSSLRAYYLLLNDATEGGSSLDAGAWAGLNNCFFIIFQLYLSPSKTLELNFEHEKPFRLKLSSPEKAYSRWIHGHYIFMVFVQALNITLFCFMSELKNNIPKAISYLNKATNIMRGSSYALTYAGDFTKKAYMKVVRPTLMPPIAPPELSGLNWRDHEFLVKHCFRKLCKSFPTNDPKLNEAIKEFKESLAITYDSHKFVCGKFVGDENSSLLTHKPAVDVLLNFKRSRLHMLEEH